MEAVGTSLVMIGSALAVIQSVWVVTATGRKRSHLLRDKARSDAREARWAEVTAELRAGWGDRAADLSNFEELDDYRPDPELDRLRAEQAELVERRDRWVRTFRDSGAELSTKMRELNEVESEWRRLWTTGLVGLVGGVVALAGAVILTCTTL